MPAVPDRSVHLVVTSPPYPMIEMWDEVFDTLAPGSSAAIAAGRPWEAFEAQHRVLDAVWAECSRVLVPGGFLCINVGDATRSVGGEFGLYPNHARILTALITLGLTPLPDILWRKPTNAPNKFMGSGVLPAGAYVTYEHEYILIARKGGKRAFAGEEKHRRGWSACFWEERNAWYSDLWTDLRGTSQRLGAAGDLRGRSAAFPFELAWRLVNMYSIYGDTVLDPFVGTGTTMAAALAATRSSVGVEHSAAFAPIVAQALPDAVSAGATRTAERREAHRAFLSRRAEAGKPPPRHVCESLALPVITSQERALRLLTPVELRPSGPQRWDAESVDAWPLVW